MAPEQKMEMDLHLYEKVTKNIKERMCKGELKVGARLPPIRDLSVMYDCNYHTIRRAMKSLSDEGLIDSKKGSGTYIKRDLQSHSALPDDEKKAILTVVLISEETPFSNQLCAHLQNLAIEENLQLDWQFVKSLSTLNHNKEQLSYFQGDGVIIPWFRETEDELKALDEIEAQIKIPVITNVSRPNQPNSCYRGVKSVGVDSYRASQLACEYFIKTGHKALILVGNTNEAYDSIEFRHRLNGFQDYCMDYGVINFICLYEKDRPDLSSCFRFIEKNKGNVAMVCYHDDIAMRIMRHLSEAQFSIPEDVSMIGFNNQSFCEHLAPPLSSLSISLKEIALAMLRHAQALFEGKTAFLDNPMPIKMHIRESCGGKSRISADELNQLKLNLESGH